MKFLEGFREGFKAPFKALKERALDAGVGALVIGLVSELAGIDIAPGEVDALVTAAAVLAALYGRWRVRRVE